MGLGKNFYELGDWKIIHWQAGKYPNSQRLCVAQTEILSRLVYDFPITHFMTKFLQGPKSKNPLGKIAAYLLAFVNP